MDRKIVKKSKSVSPCACIYCNNRDKDGKHKPKASCVYCTLHGYYVPMLNWCTNFENDNEIADVVWSDF